MIWNYWRKYINIRLEESLSTNLIHRHYFTMVNIGTLSHWSKFGSIDKLRHVLRTWERENWHYADSGSSLGEALFRVFTPPLCPSSLCSPSVESGAGCCMACLSGQCSLNSAAVRALWFWTTHAPSWETQHIRIGLGAKWLPSIYNRWSFSNICSRKAYLAISTADKITDCWVKEDLSQ